VSGMYKPEEAVRDLGMQLSRTLDGTGLAFVLIVADFASVTGFVNYASNAHREGVLVVLERLTEDLRKVLGKEGAPL